VANLILLHILVPCCQSWIHENNHCNKKTKGVAIGMLERLVGYHGMDIYVEWCRSCGVCSFVCGITIFMVGRSWSHW
jgi:ferredoxin